MAIETIEKIPALISVTGLAKLLGISRTALYEWLYTEQIPPPAKIINKRRYWTRQQIESFLEHRR